MVLVILVAAAPSFASSQLVILATTDVHANIYPWDYYANRADDDVGLALIDTLVQRIRSEHPQALLFDNGDTIQGTPLGYFVARVRPLQPGKVHPVIDVLNRMGYDAATIGNHEFNYGLPFLEQVLAGARFPVVLANVYRPGTNQPYFTPYVLLRRELEGRPLTVGVIGFTPPQILVWDRSNLQGRVEAGDIVEAARRFVPEMRAQGADVVVALAHTGASPASRWAPGSLQENAAYSLATEVPGIDVVVAGHSHVSIPGKGLPDAPDGVVGKTVIVQPGFWGHELGMVTLELEPRAEGGWRVVGRKAQLLPTKGVAPSARVMEWARQAHETTVAYVTSPIGETLVRIDSRASRWADTALIQWINDVQRRYVERALEGTQWEGVPVLSAAAPFKAGRGGEQDYTDIRPGPITIADVASAYVYDNTVKAIRITGAELKAWLERAALNFEQVTPGSGQQPLVSARWPSYNFDQIDGVRYAIDVTRPPGQRIVELTFEGRPVKPDEWFILATNNYRADGGGGFPATGKDARVVLDPLVESRQLLIDSVVEARTIAPHPDGNWHLVHNYLDHPQAGPVYDLVDRGVFLGVATDGQRLGQLDLDEALTQSAWAEMVERALDVRLPVSAPEAVVTGRQAVESLAGVVQLPGLEVADVGLTRADGAQLLSAVLAVLEAVPAR
ncbi:MAG: bifunctional 2',3'-cyclic-nucleotide 2'-phosphodiesterase/3'-nucleotidase [Limnochordaceae bacterium]|nr:bifunctional 2',3'-cyclic-nucleotide 2'-phosphodiesterase/3'-nucleotidase [Limnochordaceae bacterium]